MSLHLMPHEKIEKRFKSIQRTCRGKMKKFCSYIDRNWIKSNTWPPVNWSVLDNVVIDIWNRAGFFTQDNVHQSMLSENERDLEFPKGEVGST